MRGNDGRFRTITATGLIPLLLLMGLPGCVARHMPDWSKVQAVAPDTPTEVQLYESDSPYEDRKIKGHFLSATEDSVTLKLKDGQPETIRKKKVHKLLTRRPFMKRWPGWVILGVSALLVGQLGNLEGPESNRFYIQLFTTLPATSIAFYGARMGGIYEVPPKHREWFPQGTSSPATGTEKPEDSK